MRSQNKPLGRPRMPGERTERINILLPPSLIDSIRRRGYSVSQFCRMAARDRLKCEDERAHLTGSR